MPCTIFVLTKSEFMLEYVRGEVAEITPTYIVIDCNGVGYLANISLNTYTELQNQKSAKIYLYEAIREDAHVLYGFKDKEEREMFTMLITVSGVGPNTARMILSSFSSADLQAVISTGNISQLKAVKGIGAKTAQRIIVDLKDKIKPGDNPLIVQLENSSETFDESVAALIMLGFPRPAVQKAVGKLLKDNPSLKVEDTIKMALKIL